ncbi:substrate-binding domain-containing protein [Vibrio taketomensis]
MGRAAGEIILSRMEGDNQPYKSVVFPPKLVVRRSCG